MHIELGAQGKPLAISMVKPADMHQHFRTGNMLQLVGPMIFKRFAVAVVMPNTAPPITTYDMLEQYMREVSGATADPFEPLMTLYLTDKLDSGEVAKAGSSMPKNFVGIKYYPRGLTTNSDSGVADPTALWTKGTNVYEVLRVLAAYDRVLLLHAADGVARKSWSTPQRDYRAGEELDPYDQEPHCIAESLPRIIEAHPDLKISVEHLSTARGAEYIRAWGGKKLGCSLTLHHLTKDRRDVFRGGFHPHLSWMPVIQPPEHKQALQQLAIAGLPFVWLGSDSAPHPVGKKLADCCVGGVLTAHMGIEGYAEAFEDIGALDKLERFASVNGPRFFGLEPSNEQITLVRKDWVVTPFMVARDSPNPLLRGIEVIPFRLGETIHWKLVA